MHRAPMPQTGSAAIGWPIMDTATETSDDGPLALATAVLATAKLHKFGLAAWMAACLGLAVFYAHLTPPTYTASATLLLEPRRQSSVAGQDAAMAALIDTNRAESELQVIRSERLLAKVFDSLRLADVPEFAAPATGLVGQIRARIEAALGLAPARAPTAEETRQVAFDNFSDRVGARRVGQSYVVELSYVSGDPTLARRVANATASAYLWQSISLKADAAKNGAEFIQARIDALSAQTTAADAAVAAGALPESPTPDADARIIGAALQPLRRSAPRTGLIVTLGGVLGLISGAFAVVLGNAIDRRIRTPEDLRLATGLPCLATVPEVGRRAVSPRGFEGSSGTLASARPDGSFAAAIRDLRTSIMLGCPSDLRDGHHAVALVSWAPNAGSTLLSTNLAAIIRDSGRKVTLIDADIHRAPWDLADDIPEDTVCLADALTTGAPVDASTFLDRDGMAFLPGPSRRAGLKHLAYLGSPAMARVIDDARRRGQVILDLPALSRASDARAAALLADAVVITVVAGRTTSDEVASAMRVLNGVGANVIGAVLNRART